MAEYRCRCGSVRLEIAPFGARHGNHAICHCTYCRKHAETLGHDEALGEAGGLRLYQTRPSAVRVAQGEEHVRSMTLSKRGPLRWYAACCDSALAVTGPMRGMPFLSIVGAGLDETPGPVLFRVHTKHATGPVPEDGQRLGFARGAAWLARTMTTERLSGRWKQNPFFDDAGDPISPPRRA